jgi:hypothetical protein
MKSFPAFPIVSTCSALFLAALSTPLGAAETLAEFEGGIGSQPFASVANAVATNDVRGVPPGGRPWEIRKLKATVRSDLGQARIVVRGEGLILGGGNAVGTPALPREVAATLFCNTNEQFNSSSVPLNAAGDFEIKSALSSALGTPVPVPCPNPVLLIRNAPAGVPGAWFAAGIPRVAEEGGAH